jgi:hypothetical protein
VANPGSAGRLVADCRAASQGQLILALKAAMPRRGSS